MLPKQTSRKPDCGGAAPGQRITAVSYSKTRLPRRRETVGPVRRSRKLPRKPGSKRRTRPRPERISRFYAILLCAPFPDLSSCEAQLELCTATAREHGERRTTEFLLRTDPTYAPICIRSVNQTIHSLAGTESLGQKSATPNRVGDRNHRLRPNQRARPGSTDPANRANSRVDLPRCGRDRSALPRKQTGPRPLDAALEAPRLGLEPRT